MDLPDRVGEIPLVQNVPPPPLEALCECGDEYADHFVTFGGTRGCYGQAECPCDGWQEPLPREPVPPHPAGCACPDCALAQVWASELEGAVADFGVLARLVDRSYERRVADAGEIIQLERHAYEAPTLPRAPRKE